MIYFKCSQCGENMEAPLSLKDQLLACPKCGSHQIVKTAHEKRFVFILILLSILAGTHTLSTFLGYKKGVEVGDAYATKIWKSYYEIEKVVAYHQGYNAATAAIDAERELAEQSPLNIETESPIQIISKSSEKFPCKNIQFNTSENDLRIIGEITNDSNRTYSLINFRISIYDYNTLVDTGTFMITDFEKKQTRIFETYLFSPWQAIGPFCDFNSYKIEPDAKMQEYNF